MFAIRMEIRGTRWILPTIPLGIATRLCETFEKPTGPEKRSIVPLALVRRRRRRRRLNSPLPLAHLDLRGC